MLARSRVCREPAGGTFLRAIRRRTAPARLTREVESSNDSAERASAPSSRERAAELGGRRTTGSRAGAADAPSDARCGPRRIAKAVSGVQLGKHRCRSRSIQNPAGRVDRTVLEVAALH